MTNDKDTSHTKVRKRVQEVTNLVKRADFMERLNNVCPKHLHAETIVEATKLEITLNPNLADCSAISIFYAMLDCVRLGLMPSSSLGRAWIIPFKRNKKIGNEWKSETDAVFFLGYKGKLDLIYRHPDVTKVETEVVYENDHFDVLDDGTIHHRRNEKVAPAFLQMPEKEKKKFHKSKYIDPNSIRAVYMRVHTRNSPTPITRYFVKWEIEVARGEALMPDSPAWKYNYGAMAKGALIKRSFSTLPSSTEIMMYEQMEQKVFSGRIIEGVVTDDEDEEPKKTKAQKMAEQLTDKKDENTEPKALDDAAAFEKGCDDVFGEDTR